jgi:hypothetical protein
MLQNTPLFFCNYPALRIFKKMQMQIQSQMQKSTRIFINRGHNA